MCSSFASRGSGDGGDLLPPLGGRGVASLDCLSLGEVEDEAPPEGRRSWEEPGAGIPEGPGIRDTPGLLLPANTDMCTCISQCHVYVCERQNHSSDRSITLTVITHTHYHKYVQYTCAYIYTTTLLHSTYTPHITTHCGNDMSLLSLKLAMTQELPRYTL